MYYCETNIVWLTIGKSSVTWHDAEYVWHWFNSLLALDWISEIPLLIIDKIKDVL